MPMIALRLPPEIEDRLAALARRTGRSTDDYARDAILEHLQDIEQDVEDVELAESRLEAIRRGEAETIPLSALMSRYGLAD
jgi:RHH-type rel operon transcriptional repressor/antitoxin RelB